MVLLNVVFFKLEYQKTKNMFDLDLIQKNYKELSVKVEKAKKHLNRPLSLTEKILYAHLFPIRS